MRRVLSAIILTTFCSFLIDAQTIKTINFEGLQKTKPTYLNQFLSFEEGDELDSAKLEETKQLLVNLEMFADVSYEVEQSAKGVTIAFHMEELFTLLPIFNFGGIKENFWFQIGASEVNLSGRGNKLTTYYQYYDRSSYATHLTFDRIKQSPWGVNINLIKWSTLEPLFFNGNAVEYEYDNYTLGVDAIRHFNFRDRIEFGGAYFTEDYKKFTEGPFEGAPERVNKHKVLSKLRLIHNRVDYHFFYLNGWYNQLNLQTVQSFDNDPAFYIIFNDLKRFIRISEHGNFASRLRLGLSSNEESPFAPFVLDSYVNIRGVGNRVDRGTGAIILNAEYRYSFIDQRKLAVQGVLFSDSGSWRKPGGDFSDFTDSKNFVLFAGGGFRFIHKKIFNAIFRVDYGVNLQQPEVNGFVLGIGQYF
ncbi:POTRA domain-containing protein [Ekhidna sp.]|uniref:POTRA domain-containing protein n=1 Tax=Ekhidna sp. TaxID=2608089 RepID=UPI003B5B2637